MPRILLQQHGVVRHLASVNVGHDGSIKLDLVRSGAGSAGWTWTASGQAASPPEPSEAEQRKTKSITIHTSGRINYHFNGRHTNYAPCLMDLEGPVTVVLYSVPAVAQLDEHMGKAPEDYVHVIPESDAARVTFRFDVLPAVSPPQANEICRCGIEGLFALSCAAERGNGGVLGGHGLPEGVFTTVWPIELLSTQAIAEEAVFLRFKRAMYANDVNAAATSAAGTGVEVDSAQVEAMIAAGPGLYPPNGEGIWTCVTSVPMRITPKLEVKFADTRYEARIVELRPSDTRLSTVRVRFKVFDKQRAAYEKKPVAIVSIAFDADL